MSRDQGASVPDRAGQATPEAAKASSPSGDHPSREPKILIFSDDPERKPRLYACSGCGAVHSPMIYLAREEVAHATAMEAARDCYSCQTHSTCNHCGADCPKGWTACEPCRFQRKLDAADEIPDDGGPYCAFDGDTYYTEMDEAQDAGLEWVSPCEITYPRIDAENVLENLLDDMHEDASVDDLDAVEPFIAAVKAFNDAQRCQSWFGDVKRKIRVPSRDSDRSGEAGETQSGSTEGESAVPQADAQPSSGDA